MSTRLAYAWQEGPAAVGEWRARSGRHSADSWIVQVHCAACARTESSLDGHPGGVIAYSTLDELFEHAFAGAALVCAANERCGCGATRDVRADYHAFSTALGRDIVVRFMREETPFFPAPGTPVPTGTGAARVAPVARLTWSPEIGYQSLTSGDLARIEGASPAESFETDALVRSVVVALDRGEVAIVDAVNTLADHAGALALLDLVDALVGYTAHPLDAGLRGPGDASPDEARVHDAIEAAARRILARRNDAESAFMLAAVLRRRIDAGQQPPSAARESVAILEAVLERASEPSPSLCTCLGELCLAYRLLGNVRNAATKYRAMLRSYPDGHAATRYDFALLALDGGGDVLVDEALEMFREPSIPWNTDATYALVHARLLLRKGRTQDAKTWRARALSVAPDILQWTDVRAFPDYLALIALGGGDDDDAF